MPIVDIVIRNNIHQIACNEGEEESLLALANNVSKRVNKLATNFAKASDITLLLMAALTLEDELNEHKKNKQQLALNLKTTYPSQEENVIDAEVAQALDAIAEYVEGLVIRLETY